MFHARRSRVVVLSMFVWIACQASTGCASAPPMAVDERPLPSNVFSILGEVRAFQARRSDHSTGTATVSVEKLQKKFGKFDTARLLEFDASGFPEKPLDVKVSNTGTITWKARSGHHYLLYPDVNERLRPTYGVLCKLSRLHLPPKIVPDICTEILCLDQPFPAAALVELVPALGQQVSGDELGSDWIGGFGGEGPICDQCIPDDFVYPELECGDVSIVIDPTAFCGEGDRVVFMRKEAERFRIHVMNSDGTNDTVLSTGNASDTGPDVDLQGQKIVFTRSEGGESSLFTMDIDGSGATAVPDTSGAGNPVWTRAVEPFIVFAAPAGETTAIFRIRPDGTGKARVTSPEEGERDMMPALFDGKTLLFVRNVDSADQELFMKNVWNDDEAPVQLTTITDAAVLSPAGGHIGDDRMLAFVVSFGPFAPSQIRVCELTFGGALVVLHQFELGSPVEHNILDLDFSVDDECLFVEAQADDVTGLPDRRMELFRVAIDGSSIARATDNEVRDGSPSVVTHFPEN